MDYDQSLSQKIVKYLTANNFISPEDGDKVLLLVNERKVDLEDTLVNQKIITGDELLKIKGAVFSLPGINLSGREIGREILDMLPREISENYKLVIFDKRPGEIDVGMVNPDNYKAVEAIDFLAKGLQVKPNYHVILLEDFKNILRNYDTLRGEVTEALGEVKQKIETEAKIKKERKPNIEMDEVIKRAPVSKIVSVIIKHAVEGGASDIHIEPLHEESRIRYRIDGILHTSLILPKYIHTSLVSRIKVMADLKLDETRVPQDGRIRLKIDNRDIDFRISIVPLTDSEKVVMRILDVSHGAYTFKELGFIGRKAAVMEKAIKSPNGIFLITGPTGSGKSTTLFSALTILNKEGVNISTLEDPVEYFVEGVNQSQIRPKVGFTFAGGLRSLLRQDPDVIMVGEIRDSETAELAIHAGLTGHFVLSTLHTNDALRAIPRLLDMKVEPFLLASTLNAVIAQRLVRKICLDCKTEDKITEPQREDIKKIYSKIALDEYPDFKYDNSFKCYKGAGCVHCGNSGYKGRVAIWELIAVTEQMKEIMVTGNKTSEVMAEIERQKFVSLKQDGVIKILMGLTTLEEILRVTTE